MRYDKPIYFQRVNPGEYNPETGDYDEGEITEVKKYASVTDSGIETVQLIYGNLKQAAVTIRLQRAYEECFDYIRIGEKRYKVDFERLGRNFVAHEVQ